MAATKKKRTAKSTTKKKPAKKIATKKVEATTKTNTKTPIDVSGPSVRPGIVLLALLLLFISVTGWYVLRESSRLQDEYDKVDDSTNILLKRITPAEQDQDIEQ